MKELGQNMLCSICGFPLSGYTNLNICSRCSAMSHHERVALAVQRELADSIKLLAKVLEKKQYD